MSRKRGPIGRVRNRRNVDIGGIPAPVPVLITLTVVNFGENLGSGFITLEAMQWTGAEWSRVQIEPYLTGLTQSLLLNDISPPSTGYLIGPDLNELYLEWTNILTSGGYVSLREWETSLRGLNGEWVAPLRFFVP